MSSKFVSLASLEVGDKAYARDNIFRALIYERILLTKYVGWKVIFRSPYFCRDMIGVIGNQPLLNSKMAPFGLTMCSNRSPSSGAKLEQASG